jgi:hypothetical protein
VKKTIEEAIKKGKLIMIVWVMSRSQGGDHQLKHVGYNPPTGFGFQLPRVLGLLLQVREGFWPCFKL